MGRGDFMGLLDKLKNALFEVEYVEVEEPPKKEKKTREEKEEKPIAKKIVLPGKREERLEELHEEELKDEDFEIRPKEEVLEAKEEFKIMDDSDFKVDEDYDLDAPEIVQVLDEPAAAPVEEYREPYQGKVEETRVERTIDYYSSSATSPAVTHESKPYGVDNSYDVSIHPYGTYEKREEKTYFRPSPILSPIYGVLDKNYKKEDVKEKRDIHISSYSRSNVSVDDVRKKAYGNKNVSTEPKEEDNTKFEIEEEPKEEDNVLVDLSDRAKPEVKEITMGDAVEYFQDLGLEYNVDYVDASTDRSALKKNKEEVLEEKKEEKPRKESEEDMDLTKDLEDTMDLGSKLETKEEPKRTNSRKKEDNVGDETNDNLFDLIDSMYQENE